MKKTLLLILFAVVFPISATNAQITSPFVEGFNYGNSFDNWPIDQVAGTNWIRRPNYYYETPLYRTVGLTYAEYNSWDSNGKIWFTRSGSSGSHAGSVYKILPTPITTTSTVYFSFLVSISNDELYCLPGGCFAVEDYFFLVGSTTNITDGSFDRGRVYAKPNADATAWSIGVGKNHQSRTVSGTILNFNQTYLVVLRYDVNVSADSNDVVRLYLYNTGVPASEPGSPLVSLGPVGIGDGPDLSSFNCVGIRQGPWGGTGFIDGIRVSTSWTSAPLPIHLSSFAGQYTPVANSVRLDWTTISETNNYGFNVYRRSSGEQPFAVLANSFIPGHGTTIDPQHYTFSDNTASTGSTYQYKLKQTDQDGTVHFTDAITVNTRVTSVAVNAPVEFGLQQNYPNPWNPSTTIRYALPKSSHVTLTVCNTFGQQVSQLVNEQQSGGYHDVVLNGDGLASGVYFCRLQAGDFVATKKLILLR